MSNPYYPDHDAFVKAATKLRAIVARAKGSSFPEERDTAKRMYNKVLKSYETSLGAEQANKLEFLVRPPFKFDNEPDSAKMSFDDFKRKFRDQKPEEPKKEKPQSEEPRRPNWAHKRAASSYGRWDPPAMDPVVNIKV